jgi:hypothetical protein
MVQSFVMLGYFLKVRPFERSVENFLQVFNELVVLISIIHLFVFSDGLVVTSNSKIGAGWSFVFLVIIQIAVNSLLYFGVMSYDTYQSIKRIIGDLKRKKATAPVANKEPEIVEIQKLDSIPEVDEKSEFSNS